MLQLTHFRFLLNLLVVIAPKFDKITPTHFHRKGFCAFGGKKKIHYIGGTARLQREPN